MANIRKKLVYAAIQEAFSEADKNPNLNYQQKLLNGIISADNSLTKDEKAETARIITESGCSEIYRANWTDGPYDGWDSRNQRLKRFGMLKVILKELEDGEDANVSWFDETKSHLIMSSKSSGVVKCFGLSRNPSNGKYLLRPDIDRLYNKIFEIRNLYYQNGSNKSYNQPFHKYNINLYQFFQSNKSKSFKTDYGSRLITSKFYNFEHLSSLKPKNATEEEQRAFHSKHYAYNLSDSNNSSALKIEKYFKDLSTNLINKFKSLKINSKKDDNRNENELLQETNNNINTNHYNMNSNSINLSETKMEEDISAYSSSECSSREFSFNISDISEDIDNISSKDLADSSRASRITTEENDYVDITNSEDQDELEIPDEKI
ncbi:kinase-like domain-containing protein [Rhizophagus irregularis DAOM 181602=DAOM 197198]|nr:kinase-like domain-containing protein [Rhizophagus irregularis DAOM 181602=DAOM 197198]